MNENKVVRLQVLDRNINEVEKVEEKTIQQPVSMASNPIYKKMLSFHNAKIGEKLSITDILR